MNLQNHRYTKIVVACGPLVQRSAVVRQLLRERFSALHFAKKGILPPSMRPVLTIQYSALLAALCPRAALNLEYLVVIFVPCICRIICF
ncbi:hypothetical protein V1524DRAFT_419579, partial [Lipomyces starkeyi]